MSMKPALRTILEQVACTTDGTSLFEAEKNSSRQLQATKDDCTRPARRRDTVVDYTEGGTVQGTRLIRPLEDSLQAYSYACRKQSLQGNVLEL